MLYRRATREPTPSYADLPDFSETVIPRKMAPERRGAHEEESIHGRADGRCVARSGSTSVAEAAKAHEVSEATVYAWRKHFGAMDAVDVKRLRALEQENARLKKLQAERDLDVEILKEINAKKW